MNTLTGERTIILYIYVHVQTENFSSGEILKQRQDNVTDDDGDND